jgi:endonuclease/exonuclease/phosphatase family metal-dependent hydrolase
MLPSRPLQFLLNRCYLPRLVSFKRRSIVWFLLLICCLVSSARSESPSEIFSFDELATLYERETLPQALEIKLNKLLTTPFVENSLAARAVSPLSFSHSPRLGEFLRVACWNIERGIEYEAIEAAFTSEERFAALLDADEFPPESDERRRILEQAATLRAADVIVLNEVDWGMKRTDYRNVAADLARRLGMNYAFGVQFVELSPVRLSAEPAHHSPEENAILDLIKVEPERYKGLHGIAILSRFPLENVRLVPFKNQPYDWYKTEKNGASMLEKGKRQLSKRIFLEETLREVRRGGRTTLLADIVDARFPAGRATIVATHLENRTKPANRVKQLEELLDAIKEIRHPVVVAGDMNTSTEDLTPTSVKRELMKRFGNPKFWLRRGMNYALGFGLVEDFLLTGITFGRKHADPTVKHVPFFIPNPERKFFTTLQNFRFADGGAFDFRGDAGRSIGDKTKRLANSNERGGKGFITTFRVKRPIKIIGKYKLDWIFVKPANLSNPTDRNQSYRFAPHFGRTLADINEAIADRISDHRPLVLDLPLAEPRKNF